MNFKRQSIFIITWVLICCAALCSNAAAHPEFPAKPIQCIVTYSPGGATDLQARIATMTAEKEFGHPIAIVNKPGAGGQVGWNWMVSKAKKDGYTMATYNIPHFIAQSIVYDTRYGIDTFEPVASWGADPAVLVVSNTSAFDSVDDLVSYAKAKPGGVTVSGAGMYVGHHIAFLQFQKAAGIKMTYIPMKGGVPALQAVMANTVRAGFNNLSDAYRSRDKLKILAVADLERVTDFIPEVNTLKELGYDVDDTSVNRRGIFLPKGAPEHIIEKSAAIFPKMFTDPEVQQKMKDAGIPVDIRTRDEILMQFRKNETLLKEALKPFIKKKG